MQPEGQHSPDYSRKWIYFGVAALAAFMGTLDSSIVNVALPTLAEEFNADVRIVAWVVQAYILTMTALLLIGGRLLDIIGERKQFVLGFFLFTLGSALCAFSFSIYMLIFSRGFQALGGAVLMSSNQGLIAKAFPPNQRGRILGTIGTVVSVGLATGPPLGGFLIGTLGWRSIFYINLPIGIIAMIYSLKYLSNNPSITNDHKFDWSGSVLIVVGLMALFLGLNFGSDFGWHNTNVILLITFSIIILILFFVNENNVSHPILRLSLFSNRYFIQSAACAFLAFVALMSSSILMPFYLQHVLGFSPQKLGLFMMTVPAAMFLVAPFAGWLSDLIGTRIPASFGLALLAFGLWQLSYLDMNASTQAIIWRLSLLGIGMGVFASPNTNAILSSVPRAIVGVASGFTALMRTSGMTFGIAITVTLYTVFKTLFVPESPSVESIEMMSGIQPVFKVAALLTLGTFLLSATRGKRPAPM